MTQTESGGGGEEVCEKCVYNKKKSSKEKKYKEMKAQSIESNIRWKKISCCSDGRLAVKIRKSL